MSMSRVCRGYFDYIDGDFEYYGISPLINPSSNLKLVGILPTFLFDSRRDITAAS